jgi:hypothetical protein
VPRASADKAVFSGCCETFFSVLPVAFALGIAIYFVWPSEPGFYYLAVLPILLTDVF